MRLKKVFISSVFIAGIIGWQGNIVVAQSVLVPGDTSRIRHLNDRAYNSYYYADLDSCKYYASLALQLTDSLLASEAVKIDKAILNKCKVLKAISLTNFARGIENKNINAALDTLQTAFDLILETNDKLEEAKIYSAIGTIYDFNGQYNLAIENNLKALELFKAVGSKENYANQLTNVAITRRNMGDYGESLDNLMESLKISRELNDTATIIENLLAMGFVYAFVERWDDALNSQREALEIYKLKNDSLGISRIYNDMGVTNMKAGKLEEALKLHRAALAIRLKTTDFYSTFASYLYIGQILEDLSDYSGAVENYTEGLRLAKLTGYKISIVDAYLALGGAYMRLPDPDKALQQFSAAQKLSREIGDLTGEARASMKIAKIYVGKNKHITALSWLKKAEQAAPKSELIFMEEIYKSIAESYFKLNDLKNAYINLMKYSEVKDSAAAAENIEKITRLTNKLEFENKQALQNESHKKMMAVKQAQIRREKITRNFSLFGMFVAFMLVVFVLIRFFEKNKLNKRLNETLANLKATQSQLVHAEKMASLGELTAGIAHEIQNPLNFVNNFSEVSVDMMNDLRDEMTHGNTEEVNAITKDLKQNLEKIIVHGKRASVIVKGMLEHSRSGAGEKELTDINTLADEYLRLAYHGLRAKNKTFNADFKLEADNNLPLVNVVPQEIGRVLLNLINNAFYAVSEKAKQNKRGYKPLVEVTTKNLAGKIEIIVKDNGNGIPDSVKDKIFQPFFTTKPTGQGTGLGLSMSYDIVTKGHGGELKVETSVASPDDPVGQGAGTSFRVIIPVNKTNVET